ncbi:MAG: glutamate-5-semialdehyde dehydrogenase [Clostridia bacterium]|nr:glutamate-5-semialdehyde dehydrogenase [Clostridia bacterium]
MDELGKKAKQAKYFLQGVTAEDKNHALHVMADALEKNSRYILDKNEIDVINMEKSGATAALLDRMRLTVERITQMAEGLRETAALHDPIGELMEVINRPNGLVINKVRVPIGVIGIIYEARPNVTSDAAGLCLKSGNAVILRGGSEAIHSNKAIVSTINKALQEIGFAEGCILLVEDTGREVATSMMRCNQYIDLLIPRGGKSLIDSVIENATVPVIETGIGNCHVYVDETCNKEDAINIIVNGKVQRPAVCNSVETILINEKIYKSFLPEVAKALAPYHVEIRGCDKTLSILKEAVKAEESDWYMEYLDFILACKVVRDVDEAIEHINKYNSKHSETIVTDITENAEKFTRMVDAAAVYVNASTRFTDGSQFGFGAEIGISTQMLHARGPMGLKELTSYKYIIKGNGQIRE